MKKLFVFCILLCMLSYANAQFSFRGKVFDNETKESMPGTHIVVEESFKVVTTNRNGEFAMSGLRNPEINVKISFMGYQVLEVELDLSSKTEYEFFLQKKAMMSEEIVVRATRADENTPTPKTNLSQKEIQQMNDARNVTALIEFSPSVVTTSDAGTGVGSVSYRIRGTDESRINVTINNVPLNNPESQGSWFVNLPDFASSVDNLQIQRGVGTSSNGSGAFGGSLNFQTQKLNALPYAQISEFYGSFNTLKHNLNFGTGLIDGKFSLDGRISRITSDGYIDRATADLNSSYLSGAYYGKKTMLKALMLLGSQQTYQAWDGVPSQILDTNRTWNGIGEYTDSDGNQKFYENEYDNYKQNHFHLLLSHDVNSSVNINGTAYYNRGFGYYEQYKKNAKFESYGLEDQVIGGVTFKKTDLIRRKYLDNHFYGLNASLNYNPANLPFSLIWGVSANRFENDHYGDVVWMQYAGNLDHKIRFYEGDGVKTEASSFLKAHYSVTEKILLWADLQYRNIDYQITGIDDKLRDITQGLKWGFFNPKGGIAYSITKSQKVYASVAVAHREPTRSNIVDAPVDKKPRFESLVDYELGHELRLNKFMLQTNLYYMNYKDQLVLTGEINETGYAIMTNVDKSYRAGIELSSSLKITKKWDWILNVNLSRNKIQNFTEYVDDWNTGGQLSNMLGETDLSFSPEIIGANIIRYQPIKDLFLELQTKYVGKQYIDNTSSNERMLNPYLVNNIRVSYDLKTKYLKDLKFMVTANNVLDSKYETNAWIYRYYDGGVHKFEDGYFPQAGRNYMAGLIIGF
ncbi:MAG: TonB-dependent receptor [Bacteroidales bacterium]|nr:TonB-dependent receptor [Bacteroidales bacterium]